jgi:Fe-S cluster biogenesis protein NfuA
MSVASNVVSQFQRMLGADGGELALLQETSESVRIRYFKGVSACQDCVMSADDLREMMAEAFARQAPGIRSIEIVTG